MSPASYALSAPERGRLSWVVMVDRVARRGGRALGRGDCRDPSGEASDEAQTRPSFSAAVAASTGTVTGCGAPATAQSGSLRPLPVTVQTIF